jgi:hypothetical protein
MKILSQLISSLRERVRGRELRTYDASCEELGGAPWRNFSGPTDSWFINPNGETGRRTTVDTDAVRIRRASIWPKLALVGGAVGLVVGVTLLGGASSVSATPPSAAAVARPLPPAPAVARPSPPAPAVARVAASAALSLPAPAPAVVARHTAKRPHPSHHHAH